MNESYVYLTIFIVAFVTLLTRALPFLIFRQQSLPSVVQYLGDMLPPAIMVTLVVYCFRHTPITTAPYGIPELLAAVTVVGLQLYKGNSLLSIFLGTALYNILYRI